MSRHSAVLLLSAVTLAIAGGCGTMDERDDDDMASNQMTASVAQETTEMAQPQPQPTPDPTMQGQGMQEGSMQGQASGEAGASTQADVEFYRKALASGGSEVAISQQATTRGSAKVAALAQHIVDDHTALNQKLGQASGMSQPPPPDPENQAAAQRMQQLAGAEFDRAYLNHMAQGHAKSIELYGSTATSAQDARTRELAAAALPTLREHAEAVAQLRAEIGDGDTD